MVVLIVWRGGLCAVVPSLVVAYVWWYLVWWWLMSGGT